MESDVDMTAVEMNGRIVGISRRDDRKAVKREIKKSLKRVGKK